jgi:integrase
VKLDKKQIFRLIDEKIRHLPPYVEYYVDYKRADDRAKPNTLLSYLYDYERFFGWLIEEGFFKGEPWEVPLSVLENLRREDITSFQNYLLRYTNMDKRSSRNRMISSLKSLFHYLSQIHEDENGTPLLKRNVMAKVEMKSAKKNPREQAEALKGRVFKSQEEIADFLDFVENRYAIAVRTSTERESVKKRLLHYYELNRERDLAFISLILGSGLRVNEAVNLDLSDIDRVERAVRVERKGKEGKTAVHISNRAIDDLERYLKIRDERYPTDNKEKAVFLSLPTGPNRKIQRLTKRAAQEMVMKYTTWYGKPMSVHNLRHSFGTVHWRINRDVFALQSQLGHSDPETTQVYALIFDDTLREEIDNMEQD